MPLRNLGVIPISTLQANNIDWAFFISMAVAGVQRYTDYPCAPADLINLNIDGSPQNWTEIPLSVPSIEQSSTGMLSVSYIQLGNLNWLFTNMAQSPGIRNVAVKIYVGWMSSPGVLAGSYIAYDGKTDDALIKDWAQITLKSPSSNWAKKALGPEIGPLCPYIYRDVDTCQMGVDHLTLTNGGSGYTGGATVAISAPDMVGGIQATATATVVGGVVTALTLTNRGSGYSGVGTITVTISPVTVGSGATAIALAEPTGEVTCGHHRADCVKRANQARYGGQDQLPIPGTILYVGDHEYHV